MASQEAICRIRVTNSLSHKEEIQNDLHKASISQCVQDDTNILALDNPSIPPETRLQLVESISELVLNQEKPTGGNRVREFDLILRLDGSVVNCPADASSSSGDTKIYAARYQIPGKIIERLRSDKEKVQRAELFALGCFLYQVLSGKEMMSDLGNGEMREKIQSRYVKGEFPEDVWELRGVVRVLGCWCPGFAKDLLAARSKDESRQTKIASYIRKHPILFGFQVAGGIASLASVFALPILGVIGFGAAGPVAGSAAAALQSSIGLVEAGSIFAWCQSAAMGGAAVGGILATGLAGAGVAVGAAVTGALDDVRAPALDLREKFLAAWKRDIGDA